MTQVAYMYGFKKDEPETVGWLGIRKNGKGYVITEDRENALSFAYKNTHKTKGWASPEKWLGFFNSETELREWKFHIVRITEN